MTNLSSFAQRFDSEKINVYHLQAELLIVISSLMREFEVSKNFSYKFINR